MRSPAEPDFADPVAPMGCSQPTFGRAFQRRSPLRELQPAKRKIVIRAGSWNLRARSNKHTDTVGAGRRATSSLWPGRSAPAVQQQAQQAEYELQRQQTLAKAKVAEAEGDAQATLVKAKAQAEANRLLQETLNPLLVQSKAIDRWNGILPRPISGSPSGCALV
jgi:hypothetical protein